MGTATFPSTGTPTAADAPAERIRVFVVDEGGTIPNLKDLLEREGYSVIACPSDKAVSLMNGLVENGTELVQVSVSSPLNALALMRAVFTVCNRSRGRSRAYPVGFLTPSAGGRRIAVARS